MKIKFNSILLIICLAFATSSLHAQINYNDADWGVHPMDYSRVGTAGWQFLKLPTNARSAAMGGIISAASYGDANSAFTNPASIADVKGYDVSLSRMNWVADIGYQSLSFVKNFGDLGNVGLNLIYLDYGSMERTENLPSYDALGNSVGVLPITDGLGTFSAADLSLGVSYSRQITNKLQVGGTLKYIQERLDDAKTSNWALDIGTLYYTGLNTLRLSFVGKNFGPDAEFASYNERVQVEPIKVKMPMVLIIGAAYDVIEANDENDQHRLITALEYVKPNDGNDKINLGAEYSFMKSFFVRSGYRFNYDEEGLTFGAGINYEVSELKIKVDYAYMDVGLFKQVHMFSIGMSF